LLVHRNATETKETNISKKLKIPTGRRQTSWLFIKRERGFELGTTENQIPVSDRVEALNPGRPDYNISALNDPAISASETHLSLGWVLEVYPGA